MKNVAFIALGSNIENRERHLLAAIAKIKNSPEIKLLTWSSIYETDPVGYTEQDPFLNMVIEVETTLLPMDLLLYLQNVEKELGRERTIVWGPRTIDLDILLYNQENIETEQLVVPHPRMKERGFVLVPLFEIQQDMEISNQPLSVLIQYLKDRERVQLWKRISGEEEFVHLES